MSDNKPFLMLDYANQMDSLHEKTLYECFPDASDIFKAIGFENVPGGVERGAVESALPEATWRAINEPGGKSKGDFEDFEERTSIMQNGCEIDKAIIGREGTGVLMRQEMLHTKAIAKGFTDAFLGKSTDKRCFDGLQGRMGSKCVPLGHRDNNDYRHFGNNFDGTEFTSDPLPPSLQNLHMLTNQVDTSMGQGYFIMNPDMWTQIEFSQICLDGNFIRKDFMVNGFNIPTLLGYPVLIGYDITSSYDKILPFEENICVGDPSANNWTTPATSGPTGGSSSIYFVSLGREAIKGIQVGPIDWTFTGPEYDAAHCHIWNAMSYCWDVGMSCPKPTFAARLSGVKCVPAVKTNLAA